MSSYEMTLQEARDLLKQAGGTTDAAGMERRLRAELTVKGRSADEIDAACRKFREEYGL